MYMMVLQLFFLLRSLATIVKVAGVHIAFIRLTESAFGVMQQQWRAVVYPPTFTTLVMEI